MRVIKLTSFIVLGLLLLLALTVASLYVGERVARRWYSDITTTGDNSSYFSRQWHLKELGRDLIKLNSKGYRDDEPVSGPTPGLYRVAVIGDSYTFGQGIPIHDRYTNRLNARFKKDNRAIKLLNLGRSGAGTRHYLKDASWYTSLKPDFVVVQWFVNDFEIGTANPEMLRPHPSNLIPHGLKKYHYHYHRESVLYYVLNRGWHNLQFKFGMVENYEGYMTRRFGDPNNEESTNAMSRFTTLTNRFRQKNIPFAYVLFPMFMESVGTPDYPFNMLHDRMMALCEKRHLPCLDLRSAYAPFVNNIEALVVNQFDGHPSSFANDIASQAIYAHFEPLWSP